jgi:hypothetical protein
MLGERRAMSRMSVTEATFQLRMSLLKLEVSWNCDITQANRRYM